MLINPFIFQSPEVVCDSFDYVIFASHLTDEFYSYDGSSWTTTSVTTAPLSMAFNPNSCKLIGPVFNDSIYYGDFVESDGSNSYSINTGPDSTQRYIIEFSEDLDRWINFKPSHTTGYYSDDDGDNWTSFTFPSINALNQNGHVWAGGTIDKYIVSGRVGGGGSQTLLYTSSDGITWTSRTVPSGYDPYNAMAYSPTLDRIIGIANSPNASYSDDGINWSGTTAVGSFDTYYGACWASGYDLFLACYNGGIAYSSDGISWSAGTGLGGDLYFTITYSPALDMAFAWNGTTKDIYESSDGMSWSVSTTAPTNHGFTSVATR